MLDTLITSKTRLRLLIKFFISQANHGYLNGLAHEMGESTNSIRKELNRLFNAGYLVKIKNNNKIEYKANDKHPMFLTLQKVVRKHLGIEDMIEAILFRMGEIDKIILIGDYANGIDSGKIEAVLEGNNLDMDYIVNLQSKVENLINRKVSFYLTSKFLGKKPYIILYENEQD
tara:strand:- start:600 stop:1118 length:519 start_codon:yes stop_codon:yes gene_type:complete